MTETSMRAYHLGTVPYRTAWSLQAELAEARHRGEIGDTLLLLEHPPTITLGRGSDARHVLAGERRRRSLGVETIEVDRGGDVTFHGPGQIVGYPIIDLRAHRQDIHWYLRALEQGIMDSVAGFGLLPRRRPPHTGVWIGDRKLAAIGVKVKRWITYHGFALNVADLSAWFELIVPCGLHGLGVTSLENELAELPDRTRLLRSIASCVCRQFEPAGSVGPGTSLQAAENCAGIFRKALDPAAVTVLDCFSVRR